jgi:ribonucleoside-diphosphate reductase alpha chain
MAKIAKEGTIAHIDEIPEDIKKIFVTAHDISPEYHIMMQAAFQKYTDNAVSKTVNFPREATRDDVLSVYELAYKLGLKGVTIYRDGSREAQVLNIGKVNKSGEDGGEDTQQDDRGMVPRNRPEFTQGITQKVKIGCGNLYITVNYDENGICEVFTNLGRAGGCPSQSEATSRLISQALRSGMALDVITEQLRGIRCHSTLRKGDVKVLSCPDAIGRVLESVAKMRDKDIAPLLIVDESKQKQGDSVCPECGEALEHEGGCNICRTCGYSKCG